MSSSRRSLSCRPGTALVCHSAARRMHYQYSLYTLLQHHTASYRIIQCILLWCQLQKGPSTPSSCHHRNLIKEISRAIAWVRLVCDTAARCEFQLSEIRSLCVSTLVNISVMLSQGKYIFGDYSPAFFVADAYVYGGGTDIREKWPWKQVNLYERSQGQAISYSPSGLFSFGIDRSNELYGLTDIGIFRVTNASRCNFACT